MAVYILEPEGYVSGNSSTRSFIILVSDVYVYSHKDSTIYIIRTITRDVKICEVTVVPLNENQLPDPAFAGAGANGFNACMSI
jgi:hypothetical protein